MMGTWWRNPRTGGLLALALVIAVLPLGLHNDYQYDIAILVGLNAIVCVGLNLLIGYGGQISLGHAAFFGLGGYGSAILTSTFGWPPLAALVVSGLAVGLLAFAVARPILRLKGHYLAMATLGMGLIVAIVISTKAGLTGGPDGMSVPAFTIGGWSPSDEHGWYWIVGVCLMGAVWFSLNLVASPFGRALRAVHGSEVGAAAMGVDTTRAKVAAFVISALFASIAGSLTAHYSQYITPEGVSFFHSIQLVTMVVLGGMASTFGAVVGAAVLTTLPQVLTALKGYEMVVYGLILMATMVFMPKGLVPSLGRWLRRRRA